MGSLEVAADLPYPGFPLLLFYSSGLSVPSFGYPGAGLVVLGQVPVDTGDGHVTWDL